MITLGQLSDFQPDERAKLQQACDLVNKCLAAPAFIVLLGSLTFANTTDTTDQVVAKLLAPILITRLYCENLGWWATHVSRTVAFEAPDGTVTFNRAYFQNQSVASLANTIFHEACHVAGYSHRSATDFLSVPYQAGDQLEQYAGQAAA